MERALVLGLGCAKRGRASLLALAGAEVAPAPCCGFRLGPRRYQPINCLSWEVARWRECSRAFTKRGVGPQKGGGTGLSAKRIRSPPKGRALMMMMTLQLSMTTDHTPITHTTTTGTFTPALHAPLPPLQGAAAGVAPVALTEALEKRCHQKPRKQEEEQQATPRHRTHAFQNPSSVTHALPSLPFHRTTATHTDALWSSLLYCCRHFISRSHQHPRRRLRRSRCPHTRQHRL